MVRGGFSSSPSGRKVGFRAEPVTNLRLVPDGRPHLADTYAFLIRPNLFFPYALHG